jgi:hypothetical protein
MHICQAAIIKTMCPTAMARWAASQNTLTIVQLCALAV